MRTHGWGGSPPRSNEEAVTRIIGAAIECVDMFGNDADITKVAARLNVTRQTVYRYFPTRASLFEQVASRASQVFVEELSIHLEGITDAADAVVEVTLFCVRTLPNHQQLSFIARPGRGHALITSRQAPGLATFVLEILPIDLERIDQPGRAVLAELMVRLLQGLILDPATEGRDESELRQFLDACLRPVVHALTIRS